MKIIGIVFAYFPKVDELIENIEKYIINIDKLIIWENSNISDYDKNKILECIFSERIEFRGTGTNCGIAFPVNNIIKDYSFMYDYLLTMDQDSKWVNFEKYLILVNKYLNKEELCKTAIFGPQIVTEHINREFMEIEIVDHVITSGALYKMSIFEKIGGFREDYFIDAIDEEICYRAKAYDFDTVALNEAILFQIYGETVPKRVLWKNVYYTMYSPVRTYYIVRNHIYLIKDCKIKLFMSIKLINMYIFKYTTKIILFDDDRWNKLGEVIRGIHDGIRRQ